MKKKFRSVSIVMLFMIVASLVNPASVIAKNSGAPSNQSTSNTVTAVEISSLLANYSDYLSSGTKALIDPNISKLLDERKSFYNDLFEDGLNSKLKAIKSDFNTKEMEITSVDNGYLVKIIETVTLAGKYKLAKSADYPIIKAAQWAAQHTKDAKVNNAIQNFIGKQTNEVEESLKDIKGFETSLILNHQILIVKTDANLKILSDIFDDKAPLDPTGVDVVNWTENNLIRSVRDLTQMPDYQINHIPVDVLGTEILNTLTPSASVALACVQPTLQPVAMDFDSGFSFVSYHPQSIAASNAASFTYNRANAKSYINFWTSAATGSCPGFPTIHWDVTKYNNAQYSAQPLCNDCVNFVSQALKAGGIPTSATWQPYTTAWVNVTALLNYLTSTGTGNIRSCSISIAGDLAYLPDKSHIVMIGAVAPLRYSGHTNDRLLYTWNSTFICFGING